MVYNVNFVLRIRTNNESKHSVVEEYKTCKYVGVTDFRISATSDKISIKCGKDSEEYHLGSVNTSEYVTVGFD